MLKDYRSRVIGTYNLLRFTLDEINRDPQSLLEAVRAADVETVRKSSSEEAAQRVPVNFELTDQTVPYQLKAVEYKTEFSEVSGDERVVFGTGSLDMTVPMYNTFRVKTEIGRPLYYLVPPQWKEVIEVLKAHGLSLQRLKEATTVEIESYRFGNVQWPDGPFEGRFMPKFSAELFKETRTFPRFSVVVPVANELAKLAMNLLEPEAPDSLVAWGFFNAIFEQKEYGESYVLETLAREMMAENPQLSQEFNQKIASDSGFASSAYDRLQFFYRRSPYWDPHMNLYPVGRVTTLQSFQTQRLDGATLD